MALRLHEVHPSVVHFPLALLPASVALDLVGQVTGNRALLNTARVLMPAATASAALAGVAGLMAQETVYANDRAHDTLVTHRNLNLMLLVATATLAGVRMRREKPGWGYLLLGLGGVVAMNYTAYLGGKLPYSHGVGVQAAQGVGPESVELKRGSYGHAALLGFRYIGRGLARIVRELLQGEIVPLFRRPGGTAAAQWESEGHLYPGATEQYRRPTYMERGERYEAY